jgi:hypothetical protein
MEIMDKVKSWVLKWLKRSVKTVVEDALRSAKVDLVNELRTSSQFSEADLVHVENVAELLVVKVVAELDQRI